MSSVYVHFPFCPGKCSYCNFYSYPVLGYDPSNYLKALLYEINASTKIIPSISTLYFGGGTPSIYQPQELAKVLQALEKRFGFNGDIEITLEANPKTVTLNKLKAFRGLGINRLSIGIQSFNSGALKILGRLHSAQEGFAALKAARQAGFENLSMDLLYALPGQTLEGWQEELAQAVKFAPSHISAYELTLEPETPLAQDVYAGKVSPCGEDAAVDMHGYSVKYLAEQGYGWYEISNYALPGKESKHNINYWRNYAYLGFGSSAVTYYQGWRSTNIDNPDKYILSILTGNPAIKYAERLSLNRQAGETLMLGLRMRQGVALVEIEQRFGLEILAGIKNTSEELKDRGWLEIKDGRLCLTAQGRQFANLASSEFIVI